MPAHRTHVSIGDGRWLVNGRPTHEGRNYRGRGIEGLLLNSRMVQAIFDDENPVTRPLWAYPDTGEGAGGSAAFGNYVDGYQNPPVNWGINTARKRGFFELVREMTGG